MAQGFEYSDEANGTNKFCNIGTKLRFRKKDYLSQIQ